MAVTAAQMKTLILIECGEHDGTGPLSSLNTTTGLRVVDVLWDKYTGKSLIAPDLQRLYTLSEALSVKLGTLPDGLPVEVGLDSKDLSAREKFNSWNDIRQGVLAEITLVEGQYRSLRAVKSGVLTAATPLDPNSDPNTAGYPDPSGRLYRGDALLRGYPRRRYF